MVMFFNGGGQTLPTGLSFNTVYYLENCTNAANQKAPTTCNLSATPNGPPITLGAYAGTVDFIQIFNIAGAPGHYTVTITMYANNPGYMIEYDSDIVGQWFVPMFMESGHTFPTVRRYRGSIANTAQCGYDSSRHN
jgi:hypothetical protein